METTSKTSTSLRPDQLARANNLLTAVKETEGLYTNSNGNYEVVGGDGGFNYGKDDLRAAMQKRGYGVTNACSGRVIFTGEKPLSSEVIEAMNTEYHSSLRQRKIGEEFRVI